MRIFFPEPEHFTPDTAQRRIEHGKSFTETRRQLQALNWAIQGAEAPPGLLSVEPLDQVLGCPGIHSKYYQYVM